MGRSGAALGILCLVLAQALVFAAPAHGLETDQYTVPDAALVDVGPQIESQVKAALEKVIEQANGKANWHAREAARTPWGIWKKHHRSKAAGYSSARHLAREVYRTLAGPTVPECKIEKWVRTLDAPGRPALFPVTVQGGVYAGSPHAPRLQLVGLSPTVRVYGVYMGLDKLGHFFQQGYEYYDVFVKEEPHRTSEGAAGRAVKLGVEQETGYYGTGMIGVYSNADMASNYAGLKFYLNLTRPIRVDGRTLPPVLVRGDDGWALNPDSAAASADASAASADASDSSADASDWLAPFITDHFNEALNASQYNGQMRPAVRDNLRRRAARLLAFYDAPLDEQLARESRLATWYGEDYGHSGFEHVLTISGNCFER